MDSKKTFVTLFAAIFFMLLIVNYAAAQEMEIIFSDDFSGYEKDEDLLTKWSPFSGHWFVKDGILHQDGGGFDHGIVVKGMYLRCDYSIESKVKLVSGGAGAGMYWNVYDALTGESGNMLRYDGNRPIMYGWMHGRGFLGMGGATGNLFPNDQWHTMRMDVKNSKGTFDFYWDGVKIADDAPMYHRSGFAGLECSLGYCVYDDFKISVPKGTDWRASLKGVVKPEWIQSLALLSDGNFIYPVRNMHRVQIVSPEGKFVSEFGEYGANPGQLNLPEAIAVGKNGNIYVTEGGNNRIQVFDKTGKSLKVLELPKEDAMKQPYGIAVGDDGRVWVGDMGNNRIICFGPEVIKIGKAGAEPGQFNKPMHISIIDGKLYVADSGNRRLQIIDPAKPLEKPEVVPMAQGIKSVQFNGKDTYVVAGDAVMTYDKTWKKTGQYSGNTIGGAMASYAAFDSKGNVIVADFWNGRILTLNPAFAESRPEITDITRNSAVVRWKTDFPVATKLMLLDTHVGRTIPQSTDYSKAKVVSDDKLVTEHRVELKDLKTATRHAFAIASPVKSIPPVEQSVDYRFTTEAPEGMLAYTEVPIAVLCYMTITSEGAKKEDGSPADPAVKEEQWFKNQVGYHTAMRYFYFTNSFLKLDTKCYVHKVTRPVDGSNLGSSSEEVYKDLAELAKQLGINPEDFGAVIVAGAAGYYAYPFPTPWWGGKLTHTTGCCFVGGGDTWLSTHEFHHLTEGWFSMIMFPGNFGDYQPYCNADMPQTHKGRFGEHYDFLAHTLRDLPSLAYLNLAVGKIKLTADKDGDGVPDDDPNLVFDEKRWGTSPDNKNSYGNGLTDLQNVTAEIFTPAVKGNKNPLVTWGFDHKFHFAVSDYPYERKKKTATIDGKMDANEWDIYITSPNPFSPMSRDIPYGAAYPPPTEGTDFRAETYINWDDDFLYIAARAPYKFSLGIELDGNADGYWVGKDQPRTGVEIPRDETKAAPNTILPPPGVMVWNNVEPIQQTGWPNWTNDMFDTRDKIKWAWGKGDDGWYCIEIAIPKCPNIDFVPAKNKEMAVRLFMSGYYPPTEKNPDPRWGIGFSDLYAYSYFKLVE